MLMLVGGAILVALAGVALVAPLECEAQLERSDPRAELVWAIRLSGMLGLASLRFSSSDAARARSSHRRSRARRRFRLTPFIDATLIERALEAATRLVRVVRLRRCALHGRFGFDDPADTGRVWGMVVPLSALLGSTSRAQVDLQPDFCQGGIWGRVNVSLRTQIVQVLAIALGFALSRRLWQALRASRQARK